MQKRMLVAALGLALLLGGCSGTAAAPVQTATPTPTATPAFASDAEALAAAEAAYAKYQTMEDTISHEGGKDPDRIRPFASRTSLEEALSAFQKYRDEDLRTIGEVRFDHFEFESMNLNGASGVNALVVAGCLDVSDTDLLDRTGKSEVPANREARQTFRLKFDISGPDLLLASRDKIESKSLCG